MGAKISAEDVFRLHRSGKVHTRNGKKVAQVIMRFTNWSARARAFSTRYSGTWKERKARPHFVRPDLTKRRLSLLGSAQKSLTDHPFAHAYVDSECALIVTNRTTKAKYRFNNIEELNYALHRLTKHDWAVWPGMPEFDSLCLFATRIYNSIYHIGAMPFNSR